MAKELQDPIVGRTYQIPSSVVGTFDEFMTALNKYTRAKGVPPVDRSAVVTKLLKGLKPWIKNPENYFQ